MRECQKRLTAQRRFSSFALVAAAVAAAPSVAGAQIQTVDVTNSPSGQGTTLGPIAEEIGRAHV